MAAFAISRARVGPAPLGRDQQGDAREADRETRASEPPRARAGPPDRQSINASRSSSRAEQRRDAGPHPQLRPRQRAVGEAETAGRGDERGAPGGGVEGVGPNGGSMPRG